MSLQAIPTHLLYEIVSLLDDHDLLVLALTSRTYFQLISQYSRISRISSLLGENPVWLQLEEPPQLRKFVTELCIGDDPISLPVFNHISITQTEEDVEIEPADLKDWGTQSRSIPSLVRGLPYLKNLNSAKFIFHSSTRPTVKRIMDAFALSSPILEEFEVNIRWNPQEVPFARFLRPELKLPLDITKLSIWHTFDSSRLTKCAIHIDIHDNSSTADQFTWQSRDHCASVSWTEYDFISEFLFHSPELTHLYICVSPTVQTKILHYSWPKLEHMTIRNIAIITPTATPDSGELRQFLERHPNLLTLSLPLTSYPASSEHFITEGILPRLKSFYYDNNSEEINLPTLCQLLSPSAARNLTHLTLRLTDAALASQKGIYRQLRNLESCCLIGDELLCDEIVVIDLMKVLEHFVAHVTNIRYLQLPGIQPHVVPELSGLISVIQLLPNLTHLFGLFAYCQIIDVHQLGLLTQLFSIPRLKYIDIAQHTLYLSRNYSERRLEHSFVRLEANMADQHRLCPQNWGEFYYGTICREKLVD